MTSEQSPLEEFRETNTDLSNTEWDEVVFSDVISINDYPSAEKGEEYRSVGMSDVARDQRKIEDWEYKEYSYSRPRFRNGQTLMARITPCLENGKTAFVDILREDEAAVGSTEFIVLSDTDRTLPKFVYYTARRPEIRQFAIKRMTGTSGRQRVPLDIFDNKKINLPPIEEQKKIVSILDAIDTKIETNNRINEILEEMAEALFKSWFVDFERYDKFKSSSIGEIPNAFEVCTFGDVSENYDSERDPVSKTERKKIDGRIPYYGATKVLDHMDDYLFDGKFLLIAEDGSVKTDEGYPVIQFINKKFWASNHVHVIKGKGHVSTEFLRWAMDFVKIKPYITGSVQPKLNQANLNSIELAIPPKEDVEEFTDLVEPIHNRIWHNKRENNHLDNLRDTLLPKLMSGEIRVDDIKLDELEVDSEV